MLSVAVLGSGFMGARHAKALAKQTEVRVVGVSSRSSERAARLAGEIGSDVFTDAMALATYDNVDAVDITLPTHLHEEYTVAALNAGKHVFVEKPMALTVEACDRMIAAAQTNDRLLMVAHVLRFWPEYVVLVEAVRSGRLGRPRSAIARRLSSRPTWGDAFANPAWTGGALLDLMVHDLDVLNWLFGIPKTVYARGQKGSAGGWDHAHVVPDYGEVSAWAEGSVMMPAGYPFTTALEVLCEDGSVEFRHRADQEKGNARAVLGTGLTVYRPNEIPQELPVQNADPYEREIAYFIECVKGKKLPEKGTANQGRLAVRIALAARQSLETGQAVTL